ncbi:ovochymase-1 [Brachyistius frenatus]|uniref:ovochymase-1 n=1 Tax=Brachyistius frenatus TaxID=100188 RepID=UPI0037E8558B
MLLCLLSVCLLAAHTAEVSRRPSNRLEHSAAAAAPPPAPPAVSGEDVNHVNVTRNKTLQQHGTFSTRFGLTDLAGLRSFSPEQELETRIIGGQESWAHSWPWQVSLQFASMSACGGAIIGPLWVVSAAHCFKRYNKASLWTVLAGKHDLDRQEAPQQVRRRRLVWEVQTRNHWGHHRGHHQYTTNDALSFTSSNSSQSLVGVSVIVSNPGYNPRTKEGDVALLKLRQPLLFNQFVRPIDVWMSPLPLHRKCTITGWGSTRENGPRVHRLQEVNVTVLPSDVCDRFYAGRIRSSMFCAGRDGGGVDACQGDSGGPLSCFTGSRYELAGVVSWGVGCGRARRPGVYTTIQQHTEWMSDVMNDQNTVNQDELPDEEDMCGKRQSSGCDRAPGLAGLSVSQDGEVSVGNVTESCPFFWPWQVSLQSNGRHYCSGALIHRHWVVTAQHCSVRAKEDVVVLGVHDLHFLSTQTVPVDEVFSPLQDSSFPPKADLSLLRLSVPVRFSSHVSPVCVPEEDEELDDSWSCVTAGWGATEALVFNQDPDSWPGSTDPDRLHHAQLSFVNRTSCRETWGEFIGDAHICSHPAGSTSCMGDAGAPLYCRKRSSYFLFGVVTWGSWRCDAEKPSVFTRVSDYQSWVDEVTENKLVYNSEDASCFTDY